MTLYQVQTTITYAKNQGIAFRRLKNLFSPIMTMDELIILKLEQMIQSDNFVRYAEVHGEMRRFDLISFLPPAPSRGAGAVLTFEVADEKTKNLGKLAAMALENMGDLFIGPRFSEAHVILAVPYMMGALKTRNYKHPIGGGKFAFLERKVAAPKALVPAE